jgi:HD superfamily phosphohydrolase YqeK
MSDQAKDVNPTRIVHQIGVSETAVEVHSVTDMGDTKHGARGAGGFAKLAKRLEGAGDL